MSEATLRIGEVAKEAGIATSAIRYYERAGVLPEPDRVSGQRRYRAEMVERLATIQVAQQAGFNLDEIGELLRGSDEGKASEQLQGLARRKLPEVEALIARAEAMRGWLEVAGGCGCSTLEACGLFHDGEASGSAPPELTVVRRSATSAA